MNRTLFNTDTSIRVRNYEVDWQGIVHNANYLLYFEVGRLEYLKHIGVKINMKSIQGESKVVLVRNEINYKSPAKFDQLLKVYTRISKIKNSSFVFEGMIEDAENGFLIAENWAYHVWLNGKKDEPMSVPEHIRKAVEKFEGNHLDLSGENNLM
jgi:acyl-CoA thioester hydrolase